MTDELLDRFRRTKMINKILAASIIVSLACSVFLVVAGIVMVTLTMEPVIVHHVAVATAAYDSTDIQPQWGLLTTGVICTTLAVVFAAIIADYWKHELDR